MKSARKWRGVAAVVLLLGMGNPLQAAQARFHYVPADANGTMVLQGSSSMAVVGGLLPCPVPPRPNCMMAFRHPRTGQLVRVPLAFPVGTPNIEHRGTDWIIYNYGSYTVGVQFLADGSVDVLYNSGFLRAL